MVRQTRHERISGGWVTYKPLILSLSKGEYDFAKASVDK